jgi:malate/lactate dehydrogenase
MFVGIPVRLGASGIEVKVMELKLADEEPGELKNSAGAVRELVEVLNG